MAQKFTSARLTFSLTFTPIFFDLIRILDAFFYRLLVSIFPRVRPAPGLFAALMCQIMREYTSCFSEYIIRKTVITMGRMLLVFRKKQFCQQHPILLIPVLSSLTSALSVIAGWIYFHGFAEKIHWVALLHFLYYFVFLMFPVTNSLFTPTPSTQYPFLTWHSQSPV